MTSLFSSQNSNVIVAFKMKFLAVGLAMTTDTQTAVSVDTSVDDQGRGNLDRMIVLVYLSCPFTVPTGNGVRGSGFAATSLSGLQTEAASACEPLGDAALYMLTGKDI
jgi:hypothetical protein